MLETKTAAAPSPIEAAKMSLATPGGAIRNLGDGFQHNAFSGAGSLSFPLPTRSCRGFEPNLRLDYQPGSGSGLYGLDVAGPHRSIARQTSKRIPTYDDDDVFVLDGDPLVPIESTSRTVEGVRYRVVRYRTAYEMSFQRIESWSAGGEQFWRVLDHSDTLAVFGSRSESCIFDPSNPGRVFEWLLEVEVDSRGNARWYEYKQENDDGVVGLCERGRVQTANRYLSAVKFGNTTPVAQPAAGSTELGVRWNFELVFDFGEYDVSATNDDPYTPARTWPARPDPTSGYRSGFERRMHRLCRNVLLFHRFDELGDAPRLTQVVSLRYALSPVVSTLVGARKVGRRFRPGQPSGQRYASAELPEVGLSFVQPGSGATWVPLLQVGGLPFAGVQRPPKYALADLFGEGLPGVVYADRLSVRYWEPVLDPATATIAYQAGASAAFPAPRAIEGEGLSLADVDGDARVELVSAQDTPGFFATDGNGGWLPFRAFEDIPTEWTAPGHQLVDLCGSGTASILVRVADGLRVYPSRKARGFGQPSVVSQEALPMSFESSEQIGTRFIDILGTGTPQLVRFQSGMIEVWPSLGYGRFGDRILLDNAPAYGPTVTPSQVLFADLSGLGTLDVVVFDAQRATIYRSQSGNGYATDPEVIDLPVGYASAWQASAADLGGQGYQQLVLTTADPVPRHFAFDFNDGAKPWMLATVDEQMGAITKIAWESSTRYYLRDKARGRPWVSPLPTPVQVVRTLTVIDRISDSSRVTTFDYRDGYYDPIERTFRGFGRVDQYDVAMEDVFDPNSQAAKAPDESSHVAPSLTRSWFYTGELPVNGSLVDAFRDQFYDGDVHLVPQPPSIAVSATPPDATTLRTCAAALRGRMMRTEVYGPDGAKIGEPYRVAMASYTQCVLAQAEPHGVPYGVVFVHERENFEFDYERNPDDPRVVHHAVLKVDDWGDVTQTCAVAYPRRAGADGVIEDQRVLRTTAETAAYVPAIDTPTERLIGVVSDLAKYQIDGLPSPDIGGMYFSYGQLVDQVGAALRGGGAATAALLTRQRFHYLGESGEGADLTIAVQGLHTSTERAFAADADLRTLLANVPIEGGLEPFLGETCGYQLDAATGVWFDPGSEASYADAAGFYQTRSVADAFARAGGTRTGVTTRYTYDAYNLLVVGWSEASSGSDVATHSQQVTVVDYTNLLPVRLCDINGNTQEVLADPLGRVVAASRYGTVTLGGRTSTEGFQELPVSDPDAWPTPAAPDDVFADESTWLAGAQVFMYYDTSAFHRDGSPAQHTKLEAAAYPDPATPTVPGGVIQVDIVFYDGFGRDLEHKIRARAGVALATDKAGLVSDDQGRAVSVAADSRFRASGRVRYDVKGQKFQEFEPYYIDTWQFVDDTRLATFGVSLARYYDALGREIRTTFPRDPFPDAFEATAVYTAWERTIADRNDTVRDSRYWTWFIDGGRDLPKYEKDALEKAAVCSGTPTTMVLNNAKQEIEAIQRLTPDSQPDGRLTTVRAYDLLDREISAADPRLYAAGVANLRTTYAMSGLALLVESVDSGPLYTLQDVRGAAVFTYDGRQTQLYVEVDAFGRPTLEKAVGGAVSGTLTAVRTIYGDSLDSTGATVLANPQDSNAVGHVVVKFDQGGRSDTAGYDLFGRPYGATRRFTSDPTQLPSWDSDAVTWADLFGALDAQLDAETFASTTLFDALGHLSSTADPVGNLTQNTYDVAGLLQQVAWTPSGGVAQLVVADITYDPKGRRETTLMAAPDGSDLVRTDLTYEPDTFRLFNLTSKRVTDGAVLQDLTYWYDPEGNTTHIQDGAAPLGVMVRQNQVVDLDDDYTYDAVYRLTNATGRAKSGLTQSDVRSGGYGPFFPGDSAPDPSAVERYTLAYAYDAGNNLHQIRYAAPTSSWKTTLQIAPDSNRGWVISDPSDRLRTAPPPFDGNGNQTRTVSQPALEWDYRNQLATAVLVQRDGAPPDAEYYAVSAERTRVRKVTSRQHGDTAELTETLYFGSLEITRTRVADAVSREVQRARVVDDERQVAERLTWTIGSPPTGASSPQWRFILDDHLGSTSVEIDAAGALISYESYAPYGGTVYASGPSLAEVSLKRYRWIGKERDQSTGLYHLDARQQIPWAGRFASADPEGAKDGLNLYAYAGNNPIRFSDPKGTCKDGAPKMPKQQTPKQSCTQCPGRAWNDPFIRRMIGPGSQQHQPMDFGIVSYFKKRFQNSEGRYTAPSVVYPMLKPGIGLSMIYEGIIAKNEHHWLSKAITAQKFMLHSVALGMVQRSLGLLSLGYEIPKAYKQPTVWNVMGVTGTALFVMEGYARMIQSTTAHPVATPSIGTGADLFKGIASMAKGEWYAFPSYFTAMFTNLKEAEHGLQKKGMLSRTIGPAFKAEMNAALLRRAGIYMIVASMIGPLFQDKIFGSKH